MDCKAACTELVKRFFPNVNPTIANYIHSMLSLGAANDFETPDDLFKEIIPFFSGRAFQNQDDTVKILCFELLKLMKTDDNKNDDYELKPLETPLIMTDTFVKANSTVIKAPEAYQVRTVDQKKLQKAEERIKAKIEKKAGSQIKNKDDKDDQSVQASASQQSDRKSTKLDSNQDIHLENFDVSFGEKILLQNANLILSKGRRYGLVGRNGVGKTTLLRMISSGNLEIPKSVRILYVEQEVEADDTQAIQSVLDCDEHRCSLLLKEKELLSLEHGGRYGELEKIYSELAVIDSDSAPSRAAAILYGLGFDSDAQVKKTSEFSGGWRMRLALARALFSKPDLLLLDEPTNMLDMKTIAWLEEYLETWASTILVVSHDRAFLTNACTDILHMIRFQLTHYRGNFDNFEKTREEREKNQQREYDAQLDYRQHIQIFIDRFRYNANRAPQVQSRIKLLERLPKLIPVEPEPGVVFKFPDCVAPIGGAAVQLDNVTFKYSENDKIILRNVCINAPPNSRICIVGDNGAGKSTLIKLLLNELSPTTGERHAHRHTRFAYFAQHHIDYLDLNINAVETLQKANPGKPIEFYRGILGKFGVSGDLALRTIRKLSGGQKSRVAFALMTLDSPNFLVLDEPTNHLDMDTIDALSSAIDKFQGAVMLVTHDQKLVQRVCRELWLVSDGQVQILQGGMDEYTKLVKKQLSLQMGSLKL